MDCAGTTGGPWFFLAGQLLCCLHQGTVLGRKQPPRGQVPAVPSQGPVRELGHGLLQPSWATPRFLTYRQLKSRLAHVLPLKGLNKATLYPRPTYVLCHLPSGPLPSCCQFPSESQIYLLCLRAFAHTVLRPATLPSPPWSPPVWAGPLLPSCTLQLSREAGAKPQRATHAELCACPILHVSGVPPKSHPPGLPSPQAAPTHASKPCQA